MNRFNNTSGPNLENNYGNKGKFTPDQLKERLKVHAVAITTGFPTHDQIVAQWKARFDIDITVQSEKEWRKSNRLKIEKERQRLIESGEIEVPIVSDKVLADNLNVLIYNNCRIAKEIREKASKVLRKIEIDDLTETNAKEVRLKMHVFDMLMSAYDKTNTAVVKSFEKMSDLAGKAKLIDAKAGSETESSPLLGQEEEEDDFNPADVEISEEDRKQIAG